MSFKPTSTFELVRLIELQPEGQAAISLLIGSPSTFDDEFRQELELQTGKQAKTIDATGLALAELLERVRISDAPVIIVTGFQGWNDAAFAALDINRSRLETGTSLIFRMDQTTAARFLDRAPNLRSSIGTGVFVYAPDPAVMTDAQVADRLSQLREQWGMADDEVVTRAKDGTLQADPEFAEWLVLLGRGELVK